MILGQAHCPQVLPLHAVAHARFVMHPRPAQWAIVGIEYGITAADTGGVGEHRSRQNDGYETNSLY
jgi:hypothetical protein